MKNKTYQQIKTWRQYVYNCPSKSLLDLAYGDIFYINCENIKDIEDHTPLYDPPKFRPVMILSGQEIKDHTAIVNGLSLEKIDPSDLFGLPFTTTQDNQNNQKSKQLTKYDIKLTNYNLEYQISTSDLKPSYFRPINIFYLSNQQEIKDFEPYFTGDISPAKRPDLFPRHIGHMDQNTRDRFLTDLGQQIKKLNHDFTIANQQPGHHHLITPQKPPLEFHYRAFPRNFIGNPFEEPAKNDPNGPNFLFP